MPPEQNQPQSQPALPTQKPTFIQRLKKSIVGTNLLIFVVYFILSFAYAINNPENGIGLIFSAYMIHPIILITMAVIRLIQRRWKDAGLYFLMAIIIPIIGFGACTVAFIGSGNFNNI
jgi:uncharacterized membrane protein YhaH (DUF805 family)